MQYVLGQKSAVSAAAKKFIERWSGKGYEKGEPQRFFIICGSGTLN